MENRQKILRLEVQSNQKESQREINYLLIKFSKKQFKEINQNFLLKRHSKINGKEIYIADSIVEFENLRDKEILKFYRMEKQVTGKGSKI